MALGPTVSFFFVSLVFKVLGFISIQTADSHTGPSWFSGLVISLCAHNAVKIRMAQYLLWESANNSTTTSLEVSLTPFILNLGAKEINSSVLHVKRILS